MMKKVFCIVCMALFAISAHAQFYAGGSLGLTYNSLDVADESSSATTFHFSPEFGYTFNKYISAGLGIGYSMTDAEVDANDMSEVTIAPYVRYTFAHVRNVNFFVQGSIFYDHFSLDEADLSFNGVGFSVAPGLLVNMTDHWQLIGVTNLFQYTSVSEDGASIKQTGFALNSNISVGVLYSF